MTTSEFASALSLTVFSAGSDRQVEGCYAGDLLSWVMSRAEAGCAWITIMSNRNVAAVALMADVSCVILTEGVRPDTDLLSKAKEESIPLFGSDLSTYELAWRIRELLAGQSA